MFFDPMYLLFIAPALLLSIWASWKVKSSFDAGKEHAASSGATGAEAAAVILRDAGVNNVSIERVEGTLSDHYDPSAKVLRLSSDVYDGRSLSALGVAAHEAGHALQDAQNYPLMSLRNGLVPLASIGGNLSMILMMAGFFMRSFNLIVLGIGFFSLTVLFQLINLPVEFDASRRAKALLQRIGLVSPDEAPVVRKVLSAAAMTYVAATLMGVLQLAYFLMQYLGVGRSDDEA